MPTPVGCSSANCPKLLTLAIVRPWCGVGAVASVVVVATLIGVDNVPSVGILLESAICAE